MPPSELLYGILCEIYASGLEDQESVSNIIARHITDVEMSDIVEGHSFCVKLQRAFEGQLFAGLPVT